MTERRKEAVFIAVTFGTVIHLLVTLGANGRREDEIAFRTVAVVLAFIAAVILTFLDYYWRSGKADVKAYTERQAAEIRKAARQHRPDYIEFH